MHIAAIVEGYGDVKSVPSLVAKTGSHLEIAAYAPNPIRAGEWNLLKRPGQLERFLELAATRGADKILVIIDLDDGCVAEEYAHFVERSQTWRNGRHIDVDCCFLNREYETLFLHDPQSMGHFDPEKIPENPESIRGAKEAVSRAAGKRYKETQDQLIYTNSLSVETCLQNSRALRKLAKCIFGSYDF